MPKKILVADDDPRMRRLVAATLGNAYGMVEAADGEQALEAALKELPDLILLDIRMPGLDGIEVCRRLKASEATAQIKVVMLTGLGSDEDRFTAGRAGADAYFVKPFSPRALLEKVSEMLD
jgi:DNA-binding response OmpR family regulator